MSKRLMELTQVNISLSIQIETDQEAQLIKLVLLLFTPLLYMWRAWQTLNRGHIAFRLWLLDRRELLVFIGKVIVITIKSFAYGLGVGS